MAGPFKQKNKKDFDFGNKGKFNFKKSNKYSRVKTDYDEDSIAERKENDGTYYPGYKPLKTKKK